MESSSEHQGDGRTPWEGQEAAVAAEEDDPREQERQQHPRAEITQIKALLRRNLLVRLKRVCSLSPLRPYLGHASVAAGCPFEHRSFQNNCPPLASHFCPPQGRASNLQGRFCACLVFLRASVESTAFMNERPPRRCACCMSRQERQRTKTTTFCELFSPVLLLCVLVYGYSLSDILVFPEKVGAFVRFFARPQCSERLLSCSRSWRLEKHRFPSCARL